MFSPVNAGKVNLPPDTGDLSPIPFGRIRPAFHVPWKAVFVVFDKGIAMIIERGREDNREWRVKIANVALLLYTNFRNKIRTQSGGEYYGVRCNQT